MVRRFEELIAWQLAMELCELIFQITETGPIARNEEFRKQIRDAASAVAPLIAEGFLRYTPDEFVRYLRMARGEIGEVQTMLDEAERVRYLTDDQLARARPLAARTMGITTRLLKSKLSMLKPKRAQVPLKGSRASH